MYFCRDFSRLMLTEPRKHYLLNVSSVRKQLFLFIKKKRTNLLFVSPDYQTENGNLKIFMKSWKNALPSSEHDKFFCQKSTLSFSTDEGRRNKDKDNLKAWLWFQVKSSIIQRATLHATKSKRMIPSHLELALSLSWLESVLKNIVIMNEIIAHFFFTIETYL